VKPFEPSAKARQQERWRKWISANRASHAAKQSEWRRNHKEEIRAYYFANKAKIAQSKRDWYLANKEKVDAQVKKWRSENKDKMRQQKRRAYLARNQKRLDWIINLTNPAP